MSSSDPDRSSRLGLGLALVVLATSAGVVASSRAPLEITYLANEGFLVRRGDAKVVIDGLFGDGIRGYPVVSRSVRDALASAAPPFDGVDLLLATHEHRDHFDPRAVARHLEASAATILVTTPDALAGLRRVVDDESLLSRARAVQPAEGAVETLDESGLSARGIEVAVLRLHHGRDRPEIQNLGFVLDIGDLRVLHVGDTEATLTDFAPYRELLADVDVALLPAWFLTTSSYVEVTRELLAEAEVIAMHVAEENAPASWFGPDRSRRARLERIRRNFPSARIADSPGEQFRFTPSREKAAP